MTTRRSIIDNEADLSWLISVDDHVLEPAHVWQDRVGTRHKDQAPRLVRDGTSEYWLYEDRKVFTVGLSAVAGKKHEEFSMLPITYDDMRPGCYDSVARLEDMDRAGVLASMCFPSLPRFAGQLFYEARDRDLALVCIKAYNDWMIDEWCGSAPGRFIPLIIIPLWDPSEGAREIERCAGKGARAVAFSENPAPLGLPTVHNPDRYWDPTFRAADETGTVVCMHTGSSTHLPRTSDEAPLIVQAAWIAGALTSGTLVDWLFSGVFERFPNMKIALSEGGIGWIPYFLERAEQVLDKQRFWATKANFQYDLVSGKVVEQSRDGGVDFDHLDVRRVFRDHVYGCFIEDEAGIRTIDLIGVENVMIETDYPHSDSTWPNCIEVAKQQLAGLQPADARKIMRGNAERLFRFTPADSPRRATASHAAP